MDDSCLHRQFSESHAAAMPQLRRYVMARVPGVQNAEDVLQDVSTTLWKNYDKFEPGRCFEAWAVGVARNVIRRARRSAARDCLVFSEAVDELLQETTGRICESIDDRRLALEECLGRLQGKGLQVIRMKYMEDLPCKRIAERVRMTANAVRILLFRTRTALGNCVESVLRPPSEALR